MGIKWMMIRGHLDVIWHHFVTMGPSFPSIATAPSATSQSSSVAGSIVTLKVATTTAKAQVRACDHPLLAVLLPANFRVKDHMRSYDITDIIGIWLNACP